MERYVGYDAGGYYPGKDFGLVRHYAAAIDEPGNVYEHDSTFQDITHSRDAYVGEFICRSGYRSGKVCGHVRSLGIAAHYSDGPVYNLVSTSFCSQGGDSGGPLYHADAALGIQSGHITYSTGECYSLFQHVNEALDWYNAEVY
ncbi:S1 family peptidase [Streptomyces sp. DSM 42041]|uniref:S1 family peptidase n=1 Tax=Streptomyces hazeniae TaxID=3075538 RepID=A0ABU2P0A4_9ACTN|nr:S1 family peptidase [Streptomyces sp. DSM 42041]MDT0382663.1 S1 family peptidase [Streptomyces sp. DSM 42041]